MALGALAVFTNFRAVYINQNIPLAAQRADLGIFSLETLRQIESSRANDP